MLPAFDYARPSTLREAIDLLGREGARVHAGGSDLLGCLRDGIFSASSVVSLSALDELQGIAGDRGGLRLGALTPIAEIAEHPEIRHRYQDLADAAAAVASPQLRRQGTLGGNLCQKTRCWYYRGDFPCLRKGGEQCFAFDGQNEEHCLFGGEACFMVHPSDTAPALVALDAVARLDGPAGSRSVALEAFFVPPSQDPTRETVLEAGEILTAVTLPPEPRHRRSAYRKIRARGSWDFALAGAAIALEMDGDNVASARVVLAGAAAVPWRSRKAESALTGRTLDEATVAEAADAAVAGAEPLEHNGYKIELFRGLLVDELLALAG